MRRYLFWSYYCCAGRSSKAGDILSSLITLRQIFRIVGVTGRDDVGGQRLCREPSILHSFPQAVEDHGCVFGRRHGGDRDRDQPARRWSQWNSAMMEGELAPTGEQHQSGKLDDLRIIRNPKFCYSSHSTRMRSEWGLKNWISRWFLKHKPFASHQLLAFFSSAFQLSDIFQTRYWES